MRRVLLVALGLVAVMAMTAQGEGVARQATAKAERTEGAVVGASIARELDRRARAIYLRRHLRLYPLEARTGWIP